MAVASLSRNVGFNFSSLNSYGIPIGYSDSANVVVKESLSDWNRRLIPASANSIAKKFAELSATWKYQTMNLSSIDEIVKNDSYQEIIGMGADVLPFIFSEVRKEPHHWFWALKSITGVDPVKPEHKGDIIASSDDWLSWASENGY